MLFSSLNCTVGLLESGGDGSIEDEQVSCSGEVWRCCIPTTRITRCLPTLLDLLFGNAEKTRQEMNGALLLLGKASRSKECRTEKAIGSGCITCNELCL